MKGGLAWGRPMARRRIVALAAACGLALVVLPAPMAPAQTAPPGGTTSTAAAGGTTSAAAAGTTSTAASGGTSTTPAPTTTTRAAPTPSTPAKPAGAGPTTFTVTASASTDGTPVGIILLAVLGGLLLVIGLFVLLVRFMGWDPEWWERTKQTWREAGYQTENAISEFGDWTRLGR